ncbi:hypothetical protein [Actinokineospora pegani]|uniref:hypothetical protein n=1 Tax=Actinokineospora pegani TaxID=2654637 RepID=UPI0012EA6F75|nr:hypothetical protein [Actinokineospora pegani]
MTHTPPPAAAPARPKSKKWPWVLGAVAAIAVVAGVADGDEPAAQQDPAGAAQPAGGEAAPGPAAPESSTVVYTVSGTAKDASVTYTSYSAGSWSTNTENGVALPWTKTLEVDRGILSGGSLMVTTGMDGGEVTCGVQVDGAQAKTAKASGQFAGAHCSGF